MREMEDVIIVGGGPIGCFLGEKLAEDGFKVTILEEHNEIGTPMCCAGILGAESIKEVGLNPEDWALNELKGGVLYPPSESPVRLSRGQTEAYVIDRTKLDQDLAEEAARAGAKLKLNTRCVKVNRDGNGVTLSTKTQNGRDKLKSRMVIGADGASSTIARNFELSEGHSPTICAQAEIVGEVDNDDASVYLGNDLSRDFFAWSVPAGNVYRVGLGDSEGDVVSRLVHFLKREDSLPENSWKKVLRFTVGLIPTPHSRKISAERALLVGDAAGQVKPLTGGGLYMGLSAAEIASEVVSNVLEEEPSEENLKVYEEKIEKKFGREFELGMRARKILQKMSDEDISEFLELLEEQEVRNLILENTDFDHHSNLLKALIEKGPRLVRSLGTRRTLKYLKMLVDS